jgi:hypothetical protein
MRKKAFTAEDVWAMLADLAKQQAENGLQFKETDRQMKEAALLFKESDKKFDAFRKEIGGISNSNGGVRGGILLQFAGKDYDIRGY